MAGISVRVRISGLTAVPADAKGWRQAIADCVNSRLTEGKRLETADIFIQVWPYEWLAIEDGNVLIEVWTSIFERSVGPALQDVLTDLVNHEPGMRKGYRFGYTYVGA